MNAQIYSQTPAWLRETNLKLSLEEFEDTKGVIRIRKSKKDR
jgi:hypothetical protein